MEQNRDEIIYYDQLNIGDKVPDFEMDIYNPEKMKFEKFSINDNIQKNKWTILVFYPADFTFVCPTELKDMGDKYDEIKKLGGEVISVSTDTHFAHLAWQTSEKLLTNIKYPMGADPTGNVSRLFGVYDEKTGLALRGTFIIDPNGILVGSEINYYNVGRNASELVRKLKAFVYVSQHPEEACPANWDEGSKTLKPGEKIVGKVHEALS